MAEKNGRLVARFGLAVLGAALSGAAVARYKEWVASHPVASTGLGLGYVCVLVLIGFARQVFGDLCKRWVDRTVAALDERVTWRTSARTYLRLLRASVRDMETVGIATKGEYVLPMETVFVDVALTPQAPHAAAREPYVGPVPDKDGRRRRSLESVLRNAEQGMGSGVMALLGGPGSGKTTLARNTALALCERPGSRRRIPVLLYLRDHKDILDSGPPGLAAVACGVSWLSGKVSAKWLERRLELGRCVVLLDGLDEIGDAADRARVVAWVTDQIARHPGNHYVVTSRPLGYLSNPLPTADTLQVRPFTYHQVERFLNLWAYAVECRARDDSGPAVRRISEAGVAGLLARLRTQPALLDLAANPLLLTMIANVNRYRDALPGSRSELYAEMCDVLLHRRAEARGLTDTTGLGGKHKQFVVEHLALAMMKAGVRDWPEEKTARVIQAPLREVPGDVEPAVFLDVAVKSGLLVEREHGAYGFAHLTLQEYLAAAKLTATRRGVRELAKRVDDPWWRETILLWCAVNNVSMIVTACMESGTVQALTLALQCARQAKQIAPEVRERLNAMLRDDADGPAMPPERRRAITGALADDTLRDRVGLDGGVTLSAVPVPRSLYELFAKSERTSGRYCGPLPAAAPGATDPPAVGVRPGEAGRFVNWLYDVTGETSYRLPTAKEAGHANARQVIGQHTVWVRGGANGDGPTVLHQPEGVDWPYRTSSDELKEVFDSDLRRHVVTLPYFLATSSNHELPHFIARPSHQETLRSIGKVMARALRAPRTDTDAAIASLVRARRAAFICDGIHTRAAGQRLPSEAIRHSNDLLVELDALAPADESGGPWRPVDSRQLRDTVVRQLATALLETTEVATRLALLLTERRVTADALRTSHVGLRLVEALRGADPVALTSLLAERHDLPRVLHSYLTVMLRTDLGHAVGPGIAPSGLVGEDLDMIVSLASDLDWEGRRHDIDLVRRSHSVFGALLPLVGQQLTQKETTAALRAQMWSVACEPLPADRRPPADPLPRLLYVRDLLAEMPQAPISLMDDAVSLLQYLRGGMVPYRPRLLSHLRFTLLTVMTVIKRHDPGSPAIPVLLGAWHSLVAQRPEFAGEAPANQVLVIARDAAR